jgi:hypothetical protein
MTPRTATAPPTAERRHRVLLALAAAWMIVSLAIGGRVAADAGQDAPEPARAAVEGASNR